VYEKKKVEKKKENARGCLVVASNMSESAAIERRFTRQKTKRGDKRLSESARFRVQHVRIGGYREAIKAPETKHA
jgi:hypothetical protein